MNLKTLQKQSHAIAVSKGFWGKNGKKKRNLSELLMLCVTELAEACEALRKGNLQKDKVWRKDTFEDELCDTTIRIFDLCESENIDLEWQIEKKLAYNRKRPKRHGKLF